MPADSSCVGQTLPPVHVPCDARWLMSYAAGIGVTANEHFDTTRPGGVVAHPMFPVAPEWVLITSPTLRFDMGMTRDETARGVHARHDLHLHRVVRQGDIAIITGSIIGVERTPPGARVTVRFVATDETDEPLWTTRMTLLHLGVEVGGADVPPPVADMVAPAEVAGGEPTLVVRDIAAGAAHVYTECARIYNPIHTDRAYAQQAGLPDIMLHGTATLAHAVQAVLDAHDVGPASVARLGGSFRAMVPMPSRLHILLQQPVEHSSGRVVHFEVQVAAGGATAIRDGFVVLRD